MSSFSSDFSYAYFIRILEVIRANYQLHVLSSASSVLQGAGKPLLFLRHDIDVDLNLALRMAEIEHRYGIHSTYMIMNAGSLYSLEDFSSRKLVREIQALGHEIGLHFNCPEQFRNEDSSAAKIRKIVEEASSQLEEAVGERIGSFSFHCPVPSMLRGPLKIADRINAYAAPLMENYLSDSKGSWREGEPLLKLERPYARTWQVLIHPIWWNKIHMPAEDRLEYYFRQRTHSWTATQTAAFDLKLAWTLPGVRRRGRITAHA